jgi:hypothetical protein
LILSNEPPQPHCASPRGGGLLHGPPVSAQSRRPFSFRRLGRQERRGASVRNQGSPTRLPYWSCRSIRGNAMSASLSDQVRECLRHADNCVEQAVSQTDPKLSRNYLVIAACWLKLSDELCGSPLGRNENELTQRETYKPSSMYPTVTMKKIANGAIGVSSPDPRRDGQKHDPAP